MNVNLYHLLYILIKINYCSCEFYNIIFTGKCQHVLIFKVGVYSSKHVLIRPMWDNVRIHEEVGLPMYRSWNEGKYNDQYMLVSIWSVYKFTRSHLFYEHYFVIPGRSSHMVDALITEAQPFNKAYVH